MVPTKEEIFAKIKPILGSHLENTGVPGNAERWADENVKLEARLEDDLGADSLDRIELTMAYEEEFDISITDDAHEMCKTVGDQVNTIHAILTAKAA